MKKQIIPIIIILLLALAGGAYWLWGQPGRTTAAAPTPRPVQYQTVQVRRGSTSLSIGTSGVVRSKQSTLLTWQTSGTVARVDVVSGQKVQAQTVLARLEQTSLPQAVILAQANLVDAQRALDNLRKSGSAQALAQQVLVAAQKELDDAKHDRGQLDYRRGSDQQISAANAGYILAQDKVDHMQELYDHFKDRSEEDASRALALANLENAKKERDKAQINLNWYKGKASPEDIAEADARLGVAQARLDDAQREVERLKAGTDPNDVAAAEARVAALQATLNQARIAAPFAGTLTQVTSKAGDQVAAGTLAFQLDDLSHLYVDLSVAEVDIAQVQVGQTVQLSLEALPGKEVSGLVTEIGATGKSVAGTVIFTVTVEIQDPGGEIKPGMTATASIHISQAGDALLIPSRGLRTQNGRWVVYLLKDGAPAMAAVTLVAATAGEETPILGDSVHEGDLVILNPSAIQ